MKLNAREREIVELFKERIKERFPGEIISVVVYGSKARGDAKENSNIDLAVITETDDWKKGDKIREIGYEMDESIDYRLSIQVIPKRHLEYLSGNNFRFAENIKRDGISL